MKLTILIFTCLVLATAEAEVFFDNAVVHGLTLEGLRTEARGAGGSYSRVQPGNTDLGYLCDGLYAYADDFIITTPTLVTGLDLYAYIPGATQPIIGGSLVVNSGSVNGNPLSVGGPLVTSTFTNICRVAAGSSSTANQIQKVHFTLYNRVLKPGTYWFRFTMEQTSQGSPYLPTLIHAGATGVTNANAIILKPGFGWIPLVDSTSQAGQELAFQVSGTPVVPGRFSDPVYSPTNGFSCTFLDATVGQRYRIQVAPSLNPEFWTELTNFIYNGSTVITDTSVASTNKFFRALAF